MESKVNINEALANAKKYSNKKTILSAISMLLVIGIGVVSAIPEFVLSADKLSTSKFWTNTIINIIIGLTAFVCMLLIGQNSNALNTESKICKARAIFRAKTKVIAESMYSKFKQWIENVFNPTQQIEKNKNLLRYCGIANEKYLDLSLSELESLKTIPTKEFKTLTEEQFEVLKAIKTGKSAIKFPSVNSYLSEKTIGLNMTTAELLSEQHKTTVKRFSATIITRIISMTGIAIIFGLMGWSAIDDIGDNVRTAIIIWNILSRLFTAFINSFLGFYDGGRFNDFDSEFLEEKTKVLYQFENDKEFKEKSEEELAKEEFINFTKKKNEEYAKSIGLKNDLQNENQLMRLD